MRKFYKYWVSVKFAIRFFHLWRPPNDNNNHARTTQGLNDELNRHNNETCVCVYNNHSNIDIVITIIIIIKTTIGVFVRSRLRQIVTARLACHFIFMRGMPRVTVVIKTE